MAQAIVESIFQFVSISVATCDILNMDYLLDSVMFLLPFFITR